MDLVIEYKKFQTALVDAYNGSPLPACVKESILKELYAVVVEAKNKELSEVDNADNQS